MKKSVMPQFLPLAFMGLALLLSCQGGDKPAPSSSAVQPLAQGTFIAPSDYATPFDAPAFGQAPQGGVYLEPLCWWTGMKQPLQLLAHADGIGSCSVTIEGNKGVRVKSVHQGDSPNYLFIDVDIAPKAAAGTVDIVFSRDGKEIARQPYPLYARVDGSASRRGFDTSDMIYLIMPDRFANGDPSNDSSPLCSEQPDRTNSFGRHGGDIQGIIDHLGYLDELGVTAIWCTPLTLDNEPHASFHGYAASDYVHIDPRYGSNTLFRDYVTACHQRGIKVIMDFVPNHCGAQHWWMRDLPFNDWVHRFPRYTKSNFTFSPVMDINASEKDQSLLVSGWFDTSMPDMNLDNPHVLRYFQQTAIWWIEWAGLDGIRIDTYPYNERIPASQFCKAVTDEYPFFNLVGECWTPSVPQLAYWQGGNANADGFDSHLPSIMDFPLRDAIVKGLPEDHVNWSEGLTRIYDALSHDYAYHDLSHMMIFAANHDTERLGSIVRANPDRMKMITVLLATLRGIPQTYFGDEQMFLNTADRGDSAWRREFSGGWQGDDVNLFTREGRNDMQNDLFDFNSRLWRWRKDAKAVHSGRTLHFLTRDNTYAYFRYIPSADGKTVEKAVFVFLNNSTDDKHIPWSYYDELTPRLPHADGTNPAAAAAGRDVMANQPVTLSDATVVPAGKSLVVEF